MTFLYKFWKKARVYYTLSISKGGGPGPRALPLDSPLYFMMVPRNQFLDGNLSDRTSLIHLLDNNDSEDNNEAHIIKHPPYYSVSDFLKAYQ